MKANLWELIYCEAQYYWFSVSQYPRLRLVCTAQAVFSQRDYHTRLMSLMIALQGVWTGITFSMCVRRGLYLFFLFPALWNLSNSKIDTHDEEGLLLFGETWNKVPQYLAHLRSVGLGLFLWIQWVEEVSAMTFFLPSFSLRNKRSRKMLLLWVQVFHITSNHVITLKRK